MQLGVYGNNNIGSQVNIITQTRAVEMQNAGPEIEKLRAELTQELQMKDMLNHSMTELQTTVDELEKRIDTVDDDNNEWKTRYETQIELNQQLERQINGLKERTEEARTNIRDNRLPNKSKNQQQDAEVTAHYIRKLEKDKRMIEGEIRDYEWRLDQESTAYFKIKDRRKSVQLQARVTPNRDMQSTTPRSQSKASHESRTPKSRGNVNIQPDQRILDGQKGPIKKTAAVHTLPKLDSTTTGKE